VHVYATFDETASVNSLKLIDNLNVIFDADFHSKGKEDDDEWFEKSIVLIAIVNQQFTQNDECVDEYKEAIKAGKIILRLNLEPNLQLEDSKSDKSAIFNLYTDEKECYLNSEEKMFINIVYWLEKMLPKAIMQKEKSIDLLTIAHESLTKQLERIEIKNVTKSTLHPSLSLRPDFASVRKAKTVLAVISDEVNESAKSIEEIKFAHTIDTPLFVIEDKDIEHLDAELKELLKKIPSENQFQDLGKLSDMRFVKQLASELSKVIERKKQENELIVKFTKETSAADDNSDVKKLRSMMRFFTVINVVLILVLLIFLALSVAFSVEAVKKMDEKPSTVKPIPTTTTSTTTTTQAPIVNSCKVSNASVLDFAKMDYKGVWEFRRTFPKQIKAMIELCLNLPDSSSIYVIHFGDEMLMMNRNNNISKVDLGMGSLGKSVSMVATEKKIIFTDESSAVYSFDFENGTHATLVNKAEKTIGGSLSSLAYNQRDGLLYVFEQNKGFHVLNKALDEIGLLKFALDSQIFVRPDYKNSALYYAVANSRTLGRYFLNSSSPTSFTFGDVNIKGLMVDKNDYIYLALDDSGNSIAVVNFDTQNKFNSLTNANQRFLCGFIDAADNLVVASANSNIYEINIFS